MVGLLALVQLNDPMYSNCLIAMTLPDDDVGFVKVLSGVECKPSVRLRSGGSEENVGSSDSDTPPERPPLPA